MSEHSAEKDATEHGVRFLPPHVNAGEVIGPFPLRIAATFLPGGMSELVVRQVGPWVSPASGNALCGCESLHEHQEVCEGREGWADQW